MSVFFKVEFKCKTCTADILYEDEIPTIYTDRTSIVENNKAKKWLEEMKAEDVKFDFMTSVMEYTRGNLPPKNIKLENYYVTGSFTNHYKFILGLTMTRYFTCPVCKGRVYFE